MTDYVIHAEGATFFQSTSLESGGGAVGASAWDGNSDATYVLMHALHNAGGTEASEAHAALDPVLDTIDPATVTAVTMTLRAKMEGGAAGGRQFLAQVLDFPARFGGVFGVSGWVWPDDDAIYTLTESLDPAELAFYGLTVEDFVEFVQSPGRTLIVIPSASGSPDDVLVTATVYEAWITITYSGEAEVPVMVLRVFPRSDAHGPLGSARRAYPHSRSIQASNRVVGAYL